MNEDIESHENALLAQVELLAAINRQILTENESLLEENKSLLESKISLEDKFAIAQGMMSFEIRDEYLGNLAELGEARARLIDLEERLSDTTLRLAAEMTRAFEAERQLIVREQDAAHASVARQELKSVYASKTWRVGRLVMLPVRAIKRLFR
jgi:hypothetical protein